MPYTFGPYPPGTHDTLPGKARPIPNQDSTWRYTVNTNTWRRGDIVLVAGGPRRPSAIETYQRTVLHLAPSQSVWTHVAVYIGSNTLIEAVPFRGVSRVPVLDYVGHVNICVQRINDKPDGTNVGNLVANFVEDVEKKKAKFAYRKYLALVLQAAVQAKRTAIGGAHGTAFYNVSLVETAMARAGMSGTTVVPYGFPGELYGRQNMSFVDTGWMEIL